MSPPPSNSACPDCQAELPEGARFCWLCGAPVSRPVPATVASISVPPKVPTPSDLSTVSTSGPWITDDAATKPARDGFEETPPPQSASDTALLLVPLLILFVLMGVWSQSHGVAILLAVLIGPPLLVTCLKSAIRSSKSRQSAGSASAGSRRETDQSPPFAPMTTNEKASTFLKGLLIMLATVGGIVGVAAICALIAIISMVVALLSICGIKL